MHHIMNNEIWTFFIRNGMTPTVQTVIRVVLPTKQREDVDNFHSKVVVLDVSRSPIHFLRLRASARANSHATFREITFFFANEGL